MKRWNLLYISLLISAIVSPSVVFHPNLNVIPLTIWNMIGEETYAFLLGNQTPDKQSPSQVVVIEIDDKTLAAYGWPLDRSFFIQFLERLQQLGNPWVLSTLWFEPLTNAIKSPIPAPEREALDNRWAAAIKDYGRFIGTNLKIDEDEELTTYQEENFLPRILLRRGEFDAIPWFPLQLMDADPFVDGQKAFGFSPQMGSGTVHCAQFFLGGSTGGTGGAMIASSSIWAAALATGRSISHKLGFSWQNPNGDPKNIMPVEGLHCLDSPSVQTHDYLSTRQIEQWGFHDILDPGFRQSLADKVIVLATTNGASYVNGPGVVSKGETHKVHEHKLVARFLDGLITGRTTLRPLSQTKVDTWFNAAFAITMVLLAMWLPLELLILAAFGATLGMAMLSTYSLYQNTYWIPLHSAATSLSAAILLAALYLLARASSLKNQMNFLKNVRTRLAQCNDLQTIEKETGRCLKRAFKECAVRFEYDRTYYLASTNAEALSSLSASMETEDAIATSKLRLMTSIGEVLATKRWFYFRVGRKAFNTRLVVRSADQDLGDVEIALKYADSERFLVEPTMNHLCEELSLHWYRVKTLVEQKVKEHKLIAEKTRGDIMARFLSQAVLSKFSNEKSVEENLATVLTAKESRAALLQADIRGYSNFAAAMNSLDMVHLLRSYYQNVVDAAQEVAQVKLIGDCIFLFIERGFGTAQLSPADLMLQISSILVSDTLHRNESRPGAELNFGIAIHYGDVVVGNLSSESCIDYTVIGPHVNQVARMEELTKHREVQELIGLNGILLSDDAVQALVKYQAYPFKKALLTDLGVSVRSFADVKSINYITAEEAQGIVSSDFLKDLNCTDRRVG